VAKYINAPTTEAKKFADQLVAQLPIMQRLGILDVGGGAARAAGRGPEASKISLELPSFLQESKLEAIVRVKELFDAFNNETVEIDSRKRRLMHFERTEIIEDYGKKYIVGYLKDKFCLAYLSKEKIDENDILEFIKYGMKYKPNLQRRVILPLGDMDMNARLMAKELKMWIWDLDTINEVFDIFGRQRIVRI